ncbi:MAG: DNA polymerase III subunit epsilon [Burkholderiales bacterium]|nr:DNA polymerase III subunit epsilon [Burkholderiales bacterium]
MRQIVLDTETTGLEPALGHRIVEIGCVELVNRRPSGNTLHHYLNPERDSDEAALEVHGLTRDFLADKPRFGAIAQELLDFVAGAEIIIHNAPFDLAFLDAELARCDLAPFRSHVGGVVDSLALAKERHPGKRNNLDALCDRYGISNAHRTLHGALLDGQLLAEVYLAMTRGQETLAVDSAGDAAAGQLSTGGRLVAALVVSADAAESALHEEVLAGIARECKGQPVWSIG